MKIYLVDVKKYIKVTFEETKAILKSGLQPHEWTTKNIQHNKIIGGNNNEKIAV